MEATQELITEHGAVFVGLEILDRVAAAIREKSEEAPGQLEQLLAFFKGFVDACHHAKEEDVLFPELERRASA
jgi:hemerythrin-like domain-containing protein